MFLDILYIFRSNFCYISCGDTFFHIVLDIYNLENMFVHICVDIVKCYHIFFCMECVKFHLNSCHMFLHKCGHILILSYIFVNICIYKLECHIVVFLCGHIIIFFLLMSSILLLNSLRNILNYMCGYIFLIFCCRVYHI